MGEISDLGRRGSFVEGRTLLRGAFLLEEEGGRHEKENLDTSHVPPSHFSFF